MQIIKPPLGIKDPLVGARVSLPLLSKNLNPQPLLGRFIKPLGAIQGKGLSRFSPLSRRSKLWPIPTLESSIAWDTAFPTIDSELAHIERWGDGEIKNFPSFRAESPLQKPAKSKKPKKQAETKSRSKSSSKKVLPPARVEGNHPSVAQTSTDIKDKSSLPTSLKDSGQGADAAYEPAVPSFEDSISVPDRDSYTTAAATIDTIPHSRTGDVSQSNEKRYNLARESNQSPQAAPLLAQSIPLRPSDGNTFSAEPPLPIPGDKTTWLGSVTEPGIPNFEDLGQSDRTLSTPQTIISIPNRDLHLTASPDINTIAHSTPSRAESTKDELSENITTLSELTVPVTANSPTVINSLADDIQPIISPSVTIAPDSQTLAGDEPVETLRRSDGNTFSQHEVAQTGELTHEASTLPEPPLPILGDSPTCESLPPPQGFAVGGQIAAATTHTIPHSRTEDVSQSNEKRYNLARESNQSPQAAPLLAQSIPGEFTENINTLSELTVPVTANSSTVINSRSDGNTFSQHEVAQTGELTHEASTLPEPPLPSPGDSPTCESLPPPQGFAIGGQVTAVNTPGSQQIAPSDTVPAMLTPGEFVINTRDAQKNLALLQRINSGGTVAIGNRAIATEHNFVLGKLSTNYSSPPLIFRQPNPTAPSPTQWSSVEDLLNENTEDFDEFAQLNFGATKSPNRNSENSWASPKVITNPSPQPRGFAAGGEVPTPNTVTPAQPVTKTIAKPSSPTDADSPDLEALAREIYSRLRQRLEVERERHGIYSGRLPW